MGNDKRVYNDIIESLNELKITNYVNDEEEHEIVFFLDNNDIPVKIKIGLEIKHELIIIISNLPFKMPVNSLDKVIDSTIATNQINLALNCGHFNLDVSTGLCCFTLATSYKNSIISKNLIKYLINYVYDVIDEYNDKLYKFATGKCTIQGFLMNINKNNS